MTINNDYSPKPNQPPNDVLCIVLTSEMNILTRGKVVWETWGQQFNNIIFACNCPKLLAVKNLLQQNLDIPPGLVQYKEIANLPVLHINKVESKMRMGEKVIEVMKRSYDIYKAHASFYLMVDDDTYVFVDNLYKLVRSLNSSDSIMHGFKINHLPLPAGHLHGGSGILFTSESVKRLAKKINNNECSPHIDPYGDVTIAGCANSANIKLVDSRDAFGRPLFNPYNPYRHYNGPVPKFMNVFGSHNNKTGKECCSLDTISFHYVNPKQMHEMHTDRNFLKNLLA